MQGLVGSVRDFFWKAVNLVFLVSATDSKRLTFISRSGGKAAHP
jgi:hypothetical protein